MTRVLQYLKLSLFVFFMSSRLVGQCDLTVNAGPDQDICAPGRVVDLGEEATPDPCFIRWCPGSHVVDSTVLHTTADVRTTTSFTLKAYAIPTDTTNLVQNGDFELGDTIFTSGHISGLGGIILAEGHYILATSPSLVHTNFPPCDDHTFMNGTGQMMIINGSTSSGTDVWCEAIDQVIPDTYYKLECWTTSAFPISPAQLQFKVNGELIGDVYNGLPEVCHWESFSALWYSDDLTSIDLCIVNHNLESIGNDFVLDDISMIELCEETDDVLITVLPPEIINIDTVICEGEQIVIGGVVYDETGTYHDLMVVDDEGCDVIYNLDLQVITIEILDRLEQDITCLDTVIDIGVVAQTSAGTMRYAWTTLDGNILSDPTEAIIRIDAGGFYRLRITSSFNGIDCEKDIEFLITEDNQAPLADAGDDQIVNCDSSSVMLDGTNSTTGPEIIYEWKNPNGQIISDKIIVTVSQVGLYTLTVTNIRNGCSRTDTVRVKASDDFPLVQAGADTMFYCNQGQYTIKPRISNVVNFTIQWTTSDGNIIAVINTYDAIVDQTGHYVITVTNAATNCVSSDTVFIQFTDLLTPTTLLATDSLDCATLTLPIAYYYFGDHSNLVSQWQSNANFIIRNDTSIMVNDSGWYYLTLTDTALQCYTQDSIYIYKNTTLPIADAGADLEINCHDTVTLIGNGSSQGSQYDYFWSTPDGHIIGQNDQIVIRADLAGTYILKVTDQTNFCEAIDTAIVLFETPAPDINFLVPDTIHCKNGQVTIYSQIDNSSSQDRFIWHSSNGNILGSNRTDSLVVDAPGIYILEIINAGTGCMDIDSIEVYEWKNFPQIEAGPNDTLHCGQSSTQLSAALDDASNRQIIWSTVNGRIVSGAHTLTPTINAPGLYILEVTDISSGCVTADSLSIFLDLELPLAQINIPDTINCITPQIFLDAGLSSSGPDFVAHWRTTTGHFVDSTVILKPLIDMEGYYILTVYNLNNGCLSRDTVRVTADNRIPVPRVNVSGSLNCRDTLVLLDGSESLADHSLNYLWSGPGVLSSDEGATAISISRSGSYRLMVSDIINGCIDSIDVQVAEDVNLPQVQLDTSAELACANARLNLKPRLSSPEGLIWQWTTRDGHILSDPTREQIDIGKAGLYILKSTDPSNYCMDIDSIEVIETPFTVGLMIQDPPCPDEQGTLGLDVNTTTTGMYTLNIEGVGSFQNFSSIRLDPGTYYLRLEHQSGCMYQDTVIITAAQNNSVFLKEQYKIKLGDIITLYPEFNFDTAKIKRFNWSPQEGILYHTLYPVIQPDESTKYTLTLELDSMCEISAGTRVIVSRPDVYIPNVFTPNNDGTNDVFRVFGGLEVETVEKMIIYNRWGDVVYQHNDFSLMDPSGTWDGNRKGKKEMPGVYVYLVKIRFINGTTKIYKGSLTLLR